MIIRQNVPIIYSIKRLLLTNMREKLLVGVKTFLQIGAFKFNFLKFNVVSEQIVHELLLSCMRTIYARIIFRKQCI